jgi:hypothetical protein
LRHEAVADPQADGLARYQIIHEGQVSDAATLFGADYIPELRRIVDTHAPAAATFLEWGTGVSTLLFAEIAGERSGAFVSIDHHAEYARSAVAGIRPPAIVRSLVADLEGPMLGQDDPGCNYSSLPLSLGMDFDFIYIDGRRRIECAHTAFLLSSPSTIVVLHDYRRERYQAVKVLFDVLEDGSQFRVLKAKPSLLAATAADRNALQAKAEI